MRVFRAPGGLARFFFVVCAPPGPPLLEGAGFGVEYHESDAAHFIDPNHVPAAVQWLSEKL